MGAWRPVQAAPYKSDSSEQIKDALVDAIADRLKADPALELTLKEKCTSTRAQTIRDIKSRFARNYGINRLTQMAEAVGLRPYLEFK